MRSEAERGRPGWPRGRRFGRVTTSGELGGRPAPSSAGDEMEVTEHGFGDPGLAPLRSGAMVGHKEADISPCGPFSSKPRTPPMHSGSGTMR
jgi:hypothetical protein